MRDEQDADAGRHEVEVVRTEARAGPNRLPCKIFEGEGIGRRDRVVLCRHRDGDLAIERDDLEAVRVDRQPHETELSTAVAQHRHLLSLARLGDGERQIRSPLRPDASPLGEGDAGDESDGEAVAMVVIGHAHRRPAIARTVRSVFTG